jgi:hypothetical protein
LIIALVLAPPFSSSFCLSSSSFSGRVVVVAIPLFMARQSLLTTFYPFLFTQSSHVLHATTRIIEAQQEQGQEQQQQQRSATLLF